MKKFFKKKIIGGEVDSSILSSSIGENLEAEKINKSFNIENKFSINLFWGMIFIFLGLLFLRCFQLQIVKGGYYQKIAEGNRIKIEQIKAPRGIIKSADGEILAQNVPSFDVVFIPQFLPRQKEQRELICQELEKILEMKKEEICQLFDKANDPKQLKNFDKNWLVKENVKYDSALAIIERSDLFWGIFIEKAARRNYPLGEAFSHIIGYEGKITEEELLKHPDYLLTDSIGKTGVEFSYEELLRGQYGQHHFEVNSKGAIKMDLGVINPKKGKELVLSIEAKLQKKIYEVLKKIIDDNQDATGAVAVAINPQNGKVLALVNLPSFDNNLFSEGIKNLEDYEKLVNNPQKPLINRAITGEYPPGSTFKPMIAAIALEEGIIKENTIINCQGLITVGKWKFPDWKTHGPTDVKKAIAESCDVFFYALGGGWGEISGLGVEKMEKYGKLFGFGAPTGIDLPGELKGNLPNENWKFKKFGEKWYIGDSYHEAIGQGFVTVTPLQLASMTATIANGGIYYRPKVVGKIVDPETGQEIPIESEIIDKNFISKENIEIVREGMYQTVFGPTGSGRLLSSLPVKTAGKTGTAQFGNEDKTHSWYISFAPFDNPQIALVVLIEGGGEGHSWAVPATKEIYQWYFDEYSKKEKQEKKP